MKVYERIAQAFVAEGVTDVFGMMGDANMHWIEAMSDLGVNIYDARHEGAALTMADGWGRIAKDQGRQVPGVCTATHGPGVAQLATSMLIAARAQTPIVAFVGEVPEGDDEFAQRLNQPRLAEAIEAAYVHVSSVHTTDEAVRKAFYVAKTESRPVLLSARLALQLTEFEEFDEYMPSSNLVTGGLTYPHPDAIAKAAETLMSSSYPVIIVGRGAIWSGGGDAIRALAERSGALIATSLLAKTWLSEDDFHVGVSGLYATRTAMELFAQADCVLSFGASLNKYTTEHGYLYPNAQFIQVDNRAHPSISGSKSSGQYIQSDAALAAQALNDALATSGFNQRGFRVPDIKSRLERAFEDPGVFDLEPNTLDPREVCTSLDALLPPHVGLVLGNGHQIGFGTMLFNRARTFMMSTQHFGTIGYGLSAAIGAVVAGGRQPTLLVEGDAGLMMYLAEFDTAVRYGLPLLVVTINDEGLGAEYHKMFSKGMRCDLSHVPSPDLGAVARAIGARGTLATSVEEVVAAAQDFLANPGPMIIDARVSRNILSIPYRRLHYGIDV